MEKIQVSLNKNTVLVPTEVVRAVLGVDSETVAEKVDAGELQWVFNVSVGNSNIRELRFWVQELKSPECGRLPCATALQHILGGQQNWTGAQIQQLLMVSRPSLARWHRNGDLPCKQKGRVFWTTRTMLQQFLAARLCQKELPKTTEVSDFALY